MKIIDLLNKIAKGEERPRAIKYGLTIYRLKESDFKYYYADEDNNLFEESILLENLNEEVEIIEEDKKIKRILTYTTPDDEDFAYEDGDKPHNVCIHSPIEELFIKKINELSDEVNKMKEGK